MLKAKMQGAGLGANVNAPVASAHELLSRCSGGKGLSGIVPTNRAPQPALTRLWAVLFIMLRGFSCGAAGDWMKTQPLLMLRPPSKALVSESPNAHMRDLELDTMSQAVFGGAYHVKSTSLNYIYFE